MDGVVNYIFTFRNVVVHDYLGIRVERITPIVESDLPKLKEQLKAILREAKETGVLSVEIVRFVDDYQPGIVACQFLDSDGHRHELVDKLPYFSLLDLDAGSGYPQPGTVSCTVLERWRDGRGRELAKITTDKPHAVESTTGLSEFVVLQSQLSGLGE